MPCPYANSLGIPNMGFHKNVAGVAVNDVIGTVALAYATSYTYNVSFTYSLIGWFAAAETAHYLFGVDTAFLKALGVKPRKCDDDFFLI